MSMSASDRAISSVARFGWGGLGGMLPIFGDLVALDITDIASYVDHPEALTIGVYIGISIKSLILFVVGGIVAMLHRDIHKPYVLLQLGVVAPALFTSFINGNPETIAALRHSHSIKLNMNIFSHAYAGQPESHDRIDQENLDSTTSVRLKRKQIQLVAFYDSIGTVASREKRSVNRHFFEY
jgi:hypothetical protein